MLAKILDTLRNDNAVTFAPADDKSIRFVSSMLSSHKFAGLPAGYIEFLKSTDGIIWNGVEFYGTRAVERDALGYTFPGLIEANLNFHNQSLLKNKMILGHAAEDIFIYSGLELKFIIADRISFAGRYVGATFQELIYQYIDEVF